MQKFLINNWWWLAIVLLVIITVMVIMLVVANYREKKLFLEVEDQILSDQSEAELERQNEQKSSNLRKEQPKVEQKASTQNLAKTTTQKVATQSKVGSNTVTKKPTSKTARAVKPAIKNTKPTKKD